MAALDAARVRRDRAPAGRCHRDHSAGAVTTRGPPLRSVVVSAIGASWLATLTEARGHYQTSTIGWLPSIVTGGAERATRRQVRAARATGHALTVIIIERTLNFVSEVFRAKPKARRGAGRPPKSEERDTQQAILDAALDVFSAKGFFHASLRDIAEVVGIRDSAIYHYFPNKEALFEALLTKRAETATQEDWRAQLERSTEDVRAFLETLAQGLVGRVLSERMQKRFRILMSDGLRLQAEGKLTVLDNVAPLRPLAKVMQRLVRGKQLRAASPDFLAMEFASPFLTLMMIRIFQPTHPLLKAPTTFVDEHVAAFLRAHT